MSSTNIVRDIRVLVQNKLLPAVPRKWLSQFSFGLEAFALRPFQSAGSNARSVVANSNTAGSKLLRLLRNEQLADQVGTIFDSLGLLKPNSFLNLDHSDLQGLTALVGALQTRKGRAVPAMVASTYAHHIPADSDKPRWQKLRAAMVLARKTQSFTDHTIDALQNLHDRLGFWPRLVFDRGFGNESIVTRLAAEGATFYIRMKAGRFVEFDGQRTEVQQLADKDTAIWLYGLSLRVVRSPRCRRAKEPWYILTNDMTSSRAKIVRIYYHRFEIEELFKDTKHLFEVRRLQVMKPSSLRTLLWFVFLGIALLYLATRPTKAQAKHQNPKKLCSWIRLAYEWFQRELTGYRGMTGLTPRPEGVEG